jgi:hypothetical protein
MSVRRIVFAPLYLLADWTDDNPISALGAVVALGALAALLVSTSLGSGAISGGLALDSTTAERFVDTAIERPAYLAAAVVGLTMVVFYDG